ncbi:hypothetical protein PR048_009573 [Dryococelus australis]|uniref:Uncharacterized protein n=1 Tax=Dryococelus australis TaxID=614101 RepID=A0ABQ9I0A1_9NEOP|nr:hypothetical protein PR048_009573 [Dryococelus australis]
MRAKRGEYGAALECKGGGKLEISVKIHLPLVLHSFPSAKIQELLPPEMEPGSLWWERALYPMRCRGPKILVWRSFFHGLAEALSTLYKMLTGLTGSRTVDAAAWTPGRAACCLDTGRAARCLDPGHASRCLDPGHAVRCLDPGRAARCLDPGRAARCLEPGHAARCLDPGHASRCLDPGRAARCLDPGHAARCLDFGLSARCLDPGRAARCLDPWPCCLLPGHWACCSLPGSWRRCSLPGPWPCCSLPGSWACCSLPGPWARCTLPVLWALCSLPGSWAYCSLPGSWARCLLPGPWVRCSLPHRRLRLPWTSWLHPHFSPSHVRVRLRASRPGKTGLIPSGVASDFRTWESSRTMPLVGGFCSGILHISSLILVLLRTHLTSPASALNVEVRACESSKDRDEENSSLSGTMNKRPTIAGNNEATVISPADIIPLPKSEKKNRKEIRGNDRSFRGITRHVDNYDQTVWNQEEHEGTHKRLSGFGQPRMNTRKEEHFIGRCRGITMCADKIIIYDKLKQCQEKLKRGVGFTLLTLGPLAIGPPTPTLLSIPRVELPIPEGVMPQSLVAFGDSGPEMDVHQRSGIGARRKTSERTNRYIRLHAITQSQFTTGDIFRILALSQVDLQAGHQPIQRVPRWTPYATKFPVEPVLAGGTGTKPPLQHDGIPITAFSAQCVWVVSGLVSGDVRYATVATPTTSQISSDAGLWSSRPFRPLLQTAGHRYLLLETEWGAEWNSRRCQPSLLVSGVATTTGRPRMSRVSQTDGLLCCVRGREYLPEEFTPPSSTPTNWGSWYQHGRAKMESVS